MTTTIKNLSEAPDVSGRKIKKGFPLLITYIQHFEVNDEISSGQFRGYIEQNETLSAIFQVLYPFKFYLTVYSLVIENKHNSRKKSRYIGKTYDSPEGNGFYCIHDEQKLEIDSLEFTEGGLEAKVNYSGISGPGVNDEVWNYQKNFLISRKKFPY